MFVYMIKNTLNGKIYIGQTTKNIKRRWQKHCNLKHSCCPILSRAINKYGKENFTIEEIDGTNSLSELNYLEKHYIYKFNSLAPNGYNLQTGGKNFRRTKEDRKRQSRISKEMWQRPEYREKATRNMKKSWTKERRKKHAERMIGVKTVLGRKIPVEEQDARAIACGAKPFLVYKVTGEFVGEFINIKRFCRDYNLDRGNLYKVLNGKYKHTKGYKAIYRV